jgi:hypothetical protein
MPAAVRCCLLGGVLLLLSAGCSSDEPKLAPVQGQVFFQGVPLAGGTIVFTPDPERGGSGPLASAEIGPDGRYHLHTGDREGAVVGWHRVTVAPGGQPLTPPGQASAVTLPARYRDPERSGLHLEVKANQTNNVDIPLEDR